MGKDGTLQKMLHKLMLMNKLSEIPDSKARRKELALPWIRASNKTNQIQAMLLIDTIFKYD